ncbi:MAG TPA: Ivy family c-type lysozyme inhibitor [Roseiarcus sp.]|nr:Ivy family c-type lysozyme inhibitor [Roseiarcus sp.]
MRLAASLAFTLVAGIALAEDASFLFDALRTRPYRAAWDKLMKEVQPTPDWLVQFNKNFDGVASELTPITIEGKAYQLSFVCKPQDCANRKFEVLFDAGGEHAYGALGGRDDAPAFFGAPPPALHDALAKAIKG